MILSKHPTYDAMLPIWSKCGDCTSGSDAVKNGANYLTYLPMLPAQETDKAHGQLLYNTYRQYAVYFNATGRTVDGYLGLINRKDHEIEAPDYILENCDNGGNTFNTLINEVLKDVIVKNRVGLFVDFPAIETSGLSLADYEEMNIRPYITKYSAESILDWEVGTRNNVKVLTFVKLLEVGYERVDYELKQSVTVRFLELVEGVYQQTIYKATTELNQSVWNLDDGAFSKQELTPIYQGQKLDYIPFVIGNDKGVTFDIDYPVINDLADLNIAHYRNDASYRNGVLICGNPTPCFVNLDVKPDNQGDILLGSRTALFFSEGGSWGFLELGSSGLSEVRTASDTLEKQMALLGSKILSVAPTGIESAETARIHSSGETSVLTQISKSVSGILTKVLEIIGDIIGGDYYVNLNTDFETNTLDPQLLTALMGALQSNAISFDTFYYNLNQKEFYNNTIDEEKALIESQKPQLSEVNLDDEDSDNTNETTV